MIAALQLQVQRDRSAVDASRVDVAPEMERLRALVEVSRVSAVLHGNSEGLYCMEWRYLRAVDCRTIAAGFSRAPP